MQATAARLELTGRDVEQEHAATRQSVKTTVASSVRVKPLRFRNPKAALARRPSSTITSPPLFAWVVENRHLACSTYIPLCRLGEEVPPLSQPDHVFSDSAQLYFDSRRRPDGVIGQ